MGAARAFDVIGLTDRGTELRLLSFVSLPQAVLAVIRPMQNVSLAYWYERGQYLVHRGVRLVVCQVTCRNVFEKRNGVMEQTLRGCCQGQRGRYRQVMHSLS